eukprot:5757087-Pleurochrysis_carterae.AAC.1
MPALKAKLYGAFYKKVEPSVMRSHLFHADVSSLTLSAKSRSELAVANLVHPSIAAFTFLEALFESIQSFDGKASLPSLFSAACVHAAAMKEKC